MTVASAGLSSMTRQSEIVKWIDSGREPRNPANPGINVDLSAGVAATCFTALPYPAKRCGYFVVPARRALSV